MEILLYNTNPVVNRLISMCAKQVSIDIVCVDILHTEDITEDTIVMIDDAVFNNEIKDILESTYMGYRVLFVSKGFKYDNLALFDDIIQKPFLPSRVIDVITSAMEGNSSRVQDILIKQPPNFSLHQEQKQNTYSKQVLDQNELDKIKQILDQTESIEQTKDIEDIETRKIQAFKDHLLSDGVEITNEEEYISKITSQKSKKYKKALKELIDNALDKIIDRVGKDSFKQAIKEDRVSIEFHIKEKES